MLKFTMKWIWIILPTLSLAAEGALGPNADLGGRRPFPQSNPWNQDITKAAVDPNSANYIESIGPGKTLHPDFGSVYNNAPWGIPYVVISGKEAKVPVSFAYATESDPGPYPIPKNAPIEGGPLAQGDRHVLVVDRDHWKLYELFAAAPQPNESWKADSGAVFDLNTGKSRPAGWTSADAAGLPIFPGLVRYDEVMIRKEIQHALRFTARHSQRAYVAPATHYASHDKNPSLPPMGMRVRLKGDYDIAGFPPSAQVILKALKKYGMFLADNGGDWFLSGSPNPNWPVRDLQTLKRLQGYDFEVVKMNKIVR